MKKRIFAVLIIMITIALLFASYVPAQGFVKIEKIDYNFGGVFKPEKPTQVKITIVNSSPDVFKGKLVFERYNTNQGISPITGQITNKKQKIYTISRDFEIAGNSKKEIEFLVNLRYFNAEQILKIIDSSGKEVHSFKLKPKGSFMSNFLVGIFSEDSIATEFRDLLKKKWQGVNIVEFSNKNFPDRVTLLEAFDLIIIHNYKTSNLSEKQYQALKDYVAKKGNLLIILGKNYQKNLSLFTDNFIEGKVEKLEKGDLVLYYNAAKEPFITSLAVRGSDKFALENLEYVDFSLKDADLISQKHIQRIRYGDGVIVLTSFDPFDQSLTYEQKEKVLEIIGQNLTTTLLNFQGSFYSYGQIGFLDTAVNVKWQNGEKLLILIILYIILISFVNYFVLKKLNKRHLIWQMVLIGSIVWTGIIFAVASFSREYRLNTNAINFIVNNPNGKSIVVKKFYQIFSPFGTNLEIKSIGDQKIEPIFMSSDMWGAEYNTVFDFDFIPWDKIVFKGLKGIFLKNIQDQKVYSAEQIPIKVNVNIKDITKVNIEVENNSSYRIKNVFVVVNRTYAFIKELKPHSKVKKSSVSVYSVIQDEITNAIYTAYQGQVRNFRLLNRDTQLLNEIVPLSISTPFIIGQIENYKEDKLYVNSKILKVNSEAVFRKELNDIISANGKKVLLPGALVPYTIKNTFTNPSYYSPNSLPFYNGKGEIEFEYILPEYLGTITKAAILTNDRSGRYAVDEFLFNFKTNKWDKVNFDKPFVMEGEKIKEYIKDNKVRFRMVGKETNSVVSFPFICAEGGGR